MLGRLQGEVVENIDDAPGEILRTAGASRPLFEAMLTECDRVLARSADYVTWQRDTRAGLFTIHGDGN